MRKTNLIDDQFLVQFQLLKETETRFNQTQVEEAKEFYKELLNILIKKMKKGFVKELKQG